MQLRHPIGRVAGPIDRSSVTPEPSNSRYSRTRHLPEPLSATNRFADSVSPSSSVAISPNIERECSGAFVESVPATNRDPDPVSDPSVIAGDSDVQRILPP